MWQSLLFPWVGGVVLARVHAVTAASWKEEQMSWPDYRASRAWMEMRIEEAQRRGMEDRLRQEHGRPAQAWLKNTACRGLFCLGQLLVMAGEWLQERHTMEVPPGPASPVHSPEPTGS